MPGRIPLTEGGALLGVIAPGDAGCTVIALDARLEELDRANFRDAAEAGRVARAVLARYSAASRR